MNWLIEGLILIGIGIVIAGFVVKACDCFGEDNDS
jgi:hypothetical protein